MKQLISINVVVAVFAVVFFSSCKQEAREEKISIFFEHIDSIAQQEGISFREAAIIVRELGYNGVDFRDTADPQKVELLDSLGFEFPSLISYFDYRPERIAQNKEVEERTLSIMKDRNIKKVMLVPRPMAQEVLPEVEETVINHLADFAKRLNDEGYISSVEDYDNNGSLCKNTASIDKFFAASPYLGLSFDTGNFFFSGEDEIEALNHFLPRIKHVHLKDRRSKEDLSCPAVGTGVIRIEEIIRTLEKSGYDGWYAIEFFGSRTMLEDAKVSIENVRSYLSQL